MEVSSGPGQAPPDAGVRLSRFSRGSAVVFPKVPDDDDASALPLRSPALLTPIKGARLDATARGPGSYFVQSLAREGSPPLVKGAEGASPLRPAPVKPTPTTPPLTEPATLSPPTIDPHLRGEAAGSISATFGEDRQSAPPLAANPALARARISETMKGADAPAWFVVLPSNKYRIGWDIFVLFLLFVVFVTVPLSMAFGERYDRGMVAADLVVDSLFLVDVVLNFITAYPLDEEGLEMEMRPSRIASAYLFSWFLLDIMSCPSVVFVTISANDSMTSRFTMLKLLKSAKVLKVGARSGLLVPTAVP